jgi:UDP-glucose 4-epimerase
MAKILITGVAGFIGSSLARELCSAGSSHEVVGIDDLSTGNLENIAGLTQLELEQGNLQDRALIDRLCRGVDTIFHEAAVASVPKSVLDPITSHKANVDGTLTLLLAAREAGVRRIVYAASSSAYGDSPTLPKQESMPTAPISPYAVQKLAAEHYMQSFHHVYGMETVCLRYFNVFGPHQAADSPYSGVLAKFITSMLEGKTPTIFGDGSQSRDFTYIDNVVQANMLAAQAPAEKVAGKVYNVACGERESLLETYRLIAELVGFKEPPIFGPPRTGDVQHSLADITRARVDLGYQPTVGFQDGLRRTIAWYRTKPDKANDLDQPTFAAKV